MSLKVYRQGPIVHKVQHITSTTKKQLPNYIHTSELLPSSWLSGLAQASLVSSSVEAASVCRAPNKWKQNEKHSHY